jgi:hypothetical protein
MICGKLRIPLLCMSKAEPGSVPWGDGVQITPAGPRHLEGATDLPPVPLVTEHVRKSIYNGARTLQ